MTILVLSPHPDDEVLGLGGTLAAAAEAKERTIVVIFSNGVGSHPLHKEKLIIKTRKEEALEASRILGVSRTEFLLLQDLDLRREIVEKDVLEKLWTIIKEEKPTKIFMPALDDMHSDHRAVAQSMLQLYAQYDMKTRIYTFTIWNPLSFLKRSEPRLVVDVSTQQHKKLEAIRAYKSQWVSLYQLVPIIWIKTFAAGLRYGYRWAEVFIQVR